jgi:hypothetical protein
MCSFPSHSIGLVRVKVLQVLSKFHHFRHRGEREFAL